MVTWRGDQILELAVSALKAGAFERAGDLCVQALRVKPELAEAWHVRGICLLKERRFFDALVYFDRSLSIREDQPDVWSNRGYAFAENGMWESARLSFQRALELANTATPHILCGGMFAHTMELEAAAKEFEAALEIEPQNQDARVKLGVIYLALGRWKEGFENYHWRWFDTPFPPRPFRTFKPWQGEDLDDMTILLFSEQGYGDEIMALRFVNSVQDRYPFARVILEVRPTAKRLAEASFGSDVLASGDQYIDPASIDFSCPLLDVPRLLGLGPADIRSGAYLTTQPRYGDQPDEFAKRLANLPEGLRVGLCWSSGRRPLQPETEASASAKSIPLEMLRPLMGLKNSGINFVSLQVPKADIPRGMPIANFVELIDDLHDTAQFIKSLDLVITVDTAVAHLAGALGKPVWNLVRFNGYWPWMRENDLSIWYASMKIFRQPELGDWESVIGCLKTSLESLVAGR